MLFANKHPMKGYEEKYPADSKGAALEDQTAGVGLRVVAKQVLLGMRYVHMFNQSISTVRSHASYQLSGRFLVAFAPDTWNWLEYQWSE